MIRPTLAVLFFIPWAGRSEEPLAVTAVRFWSLGGVTRIAIESTGEFEYRSDRLTNPDRVYFDLSGAVNRVGKKRRIQHVIPVGDGLVKQIRVAETQHDTRVVVDLEAPAEVTASQLANPDRLMLEVRPASDRPANPPQLPSPPEIRSMETPQSVTPGIPSALKNTPPPKPEAMGLPAKRDSLGNRSLVRVLGLKIGRVVIDPGHGGHDAGTIGPSGITEKEVVLDVAKRLRALIELRLGSEVVLTRTEDRFVALEERTALANELRADLFLSIHVNSSAVRSASGVETYYLNFSSSRADMEVAARENAASRKTVHELRELLQKIALKDKLEESRELASSVQSALFPVSARVNSRARNRGVKKAPFVVLIGASMPSILTEIGFVSNAKEETLMRKAEHRQRIAEALFKGVSKYASALSHFQVAQGKN